MSGAWHMGEVFVLRHAGLPFDWLEELGYPPEVAAAADRLLALEAELGRPVTGLREPSRRNRGAENDEALARWRALEALAADALPALRARLHERACEADVQEAVFLSSPEMFDNVWSRYVASAERPDNAKWGRIERQVYSYLQRLCGKNETTSFFGPMGYAEIEPGGPPFAVEVRPRSAAVRRTFLSFWVVQALAKAIARERELFAHVPLWRNPTFRVREGRATCELLAVDRELTPAQQSLVERLEREALTPVALAAQVGQALRPLVREVVPLLEMGLLVRGIPLDADRFDVFDQLVRAVGELPDLPAAVRWRTALAELEGLRAAFAAADLAGRQRLLPELEQKASLLTGAEPRRGAGQYYADRFVFYEEAASRFRLRLTPELAEELCARIGPALEASARYGGRVQQQYREEVAARFTPGEEPDFLAYAQRCRPTEALGSRFSGVPPVELPLGQGEAQVEVDRFGPEFDGGRFALPDLCLCAPSVEAIARGEVDVLVARVHHHLLAWNWLFAFYEDEARARSVARQFLEQEPGGARITALAVTRRNKGFYAFPGPRVAYEPSHPPAAGLGSAADLTVRIGPDGPELLGADGEPLWLYLPLADFTTYAPFAALSHPQVLHAPIGRPDEEVSRVRIGGAIYQRRRWRVDLGSLLGHSGIALYVEARRLAKGLGLPRFVFARVDSERKPVLVDLESPFALSLLQHQVRKDAEVLLEEMLPAPEDLWLRDERGRYTCELRVQVQRPGEVS